MMSGTCGALRQGATGVIAFGAESLGTIESDRPAIPSPRDDWRKIAVTLIDAQKGEEKAHACLTPVYNTGMTQ
jgi:predicted secreted protein